MLLVTIPVAVVLALLVVFLIGGPGYWFKGQTYGFWY